MELTKEMILQAKDIPVEKVEVPEWGEGAYVYVKGLTGAERDKFEASIIEQRGTLQRINLENARSKLCVACICDQDGKRLFSDDEINVLAGKSAIALERIFTAAQRLSGLLPNDIEKMTKN